MRKTLASTVLIGQMLLCCSALSQFMPVSASPPSDDPLFLRSPSEYELLGLSVEGVDDETRRLFVMRTSGMKVGQKLTIPGDEAFGTAIKRLYRLGIFSDIDIYIDQMIENGVYLGIRVKNEPTLDSYDFLDIKKSERDDLRKKVPLLRGRAVRPGDIDRSIQSIKKFYREKGFPQAVATVTRTETADNRVKLDFNIDRGKRVLIKDVIVNGSEQISAAKIRRKMKETKAKKWWRFWKRETFDESKFQEDLEKVVAFYNEKGFYDARVVQDTVWSYEEDGTPWMNVEVSVEEGPKYHIRNIVWDGNTEYTDEQLSQSLGFIKGSPWNGKKLESNLYGNAASSDVGSLYYNRGYVQFSATPSIATVEGDSLDLSFQVFEGDIYEFGDIGIRGNNKTKEHVVRRMLRTVPGRTFTRDDITRSLRELSQLGYFNPETLSPDTKINPETKQVDITYNLEETGGDQLEFSGGWGGYGGLLLQVGLRFNNFSIQNVFNKEAWKPLPSGDGQQLSLGVQVQGQYYQNYSVSYTEPWFKGRPRPLGFSVSHSRYNLAASSVSQYYSRLYGQDFRQSSDEDKFSITSAQMSYGQALKWPDDYFQMVSLVGYRLYDLGEARSQSVGLPDGQNQAITLTQRVTRNSMDDPMFPTAGSSLLMSLEVAPPLPGFIQYHKWQLQTDWNLPIAGKLSLGVSANYGYVGSLTGERVAFERYLVGGTPFDAQYGFFGYGRDLIYMRGYPPRSIGPRSATSDLVGGSILNHYKSEIRVMAARTPQFSLQPYAFFDAANTWDGFANYNPYTLYRSTGVGVRIFLPILGMLNLNYGRNLDRFPAVSGDDGSKKWRFQFSLGQSF